MNRPAYSNNIKTQPEEHTSPNNKFQRVNKNLMKSTPKDTLPNSEQTSSIQTQNFQKSTSQIQKGKPFARTSRAIEKSQIKQEVQQQTKTISRKQKIQTSPNENILNNAKIELNYNIMIPQNLIRSAQQQGSTKAIQRNISDFNQPKNSLTTRQSQPKVLLSPRQIKKIQTAHTKILYYSMSQTQKRALLSLQRIAFTNIKQISLKLQKQNYNISNQSLKMKMKKCKEGLCNILNLLYRHKLKMHVNVLKDNKMKKQFYQKNVGNVFNLYGNLKNKRSVKSCVQGLKKFVWRRADLLNTFALALNFCNREKKATAFQKIFNSSAASKSLNQQPFNIPKSESVKQIDNKKPASSPLPINKNIPPSNVDSNKKQKIEEQINLKNQQINALQDTMKDKKRKQETQSKKLKKKIEDLTKQTQRNKKDFTQKNKKKQKMMTEIQNYNKNKSKVDNISEDNKNSSQSFKLIQQIYIKVHRISLDQNPLLIIQQIIQQNQQFTRNYLVNVISQWIYLNRHIHLQNQIKLYEKSILGDKGTVSDNVHYQKLKEQHTMVLNMTNNFIKEKYLWKEIQNFVSTMT